MTNIPSGPIPAPIAELLIHGLDASTLALGLFDPSDRIAYSNAAFRRAVDLPPGEQSFASMVRHCHASRRGLLVEADDVEAWLENAGRKRRTQEARSFEVDLCDGSWMLAHETALPGGWLLLAFTDLTAFKHKEADLKTARDAALHLAETDHLTGLSSRGSILRFLDGCIEAAQPAGALSIALIDIDHFKRHNDTNGHSAGDDILRRFAAHCRQAFRASDRVGRVGGEEFLVVMPHTDQNLARLAMHRCRLQWLEAHRGLAPHLACTFSAGVAQWRPGQDSATLYRSADTALYQAKALGRDRIVATIQGERAMASTA